MTEPVAAAFALPDHALAGVGSRPFGIYIHVPFCATRCGYCDFNTYTAGELGTSASPQSWLEGLRRELDAAAAMLGAVGARRRRPGRRAWRGPLELRPGRGRRGDHGIEPRVHLAGVLRPPPRGRVHPHLAWHAVGGAARAQDPR